MFIFSFYSKLICRFRMSNQTLVHNMRCQNQLQWGELEIRKKKALPLLIQVGYILYLHKMGGKAFETLRSQHCVWL